MSDRLEDFVRQNREEFDQHMPDPGIWLKINPTQVPLGKEGRGSEEEGGGKTGDSKTLRSLRWLRVAASIALIFAASSAGIWFLTAERTGSGQLSDLYQEIQETEMYYAGMIEERCEELKPFLASDPEMDALLQADMEELDAAFEDLKEDLNDNVSNPEVVEAMILNYRVKLEILEDLLYQLKEKENQDEKDQGVNL